MFIYYETNKKEGSLKVQSSSNIFASRNTVTPQNIKDMRLQHDLSRNIFTLL